MNDYSDLIKACEGRIRPGPFDAPTDCDWGIKEVSGVDELIKAFRHGNWSARTGFVLDDLAFVEQVGGGNEWLALKRDGGEWKTFDSISFRHMLNQHGEDYCREYIGRLRETPWHDLKYPQEQAESQETITMGGMTL